MNVILCLDNKKGMMFNGRRQSRDRVVRERIARMAAGNVLRMNSYSAGQFREKLPNVRVSDSFMEESKAGEYCFVENTPLAPWVDQIEELTVFRWNRSYPADVRLDLELDGGWKLAKTEDFPGYSHDKITMEVYRR